MKITGEQLVKQALTHLGMPYIYGMKGELLTQKKFDTLQRRYGKSYVWESDRKKIGNVCCDCSGLIYMCIKELGGGSYNYGSTQLYDKSVKYSIKDINKAPIGAILWLPGHVGIYMGNGYYVAADGSAYNCRKAPLNKQNWTHYLLLPYVDYTKSQGVTPTQSGQVDQVQLANAVSKMIKAGVKIDYNDWKCENLMKLKYAELLILKMTNTLFKTEYTQYNECINLLVEKNIITSSTVWLDRSALSKTAFVAMLMIKIAATI